MTFRERVIIALIAAGGAVAAASIAAVVHLMPPARQGSQDTGTKPTTIINTGPGSSQIGPGASNNRVTINQ